MDDYMTNSIPIFKFLFIAALVGYSTTSLSALASRLRLAA
jgi:hypothetical protein